MIVYLTTLPVTDRQAYSSNVTLVSEEPDELGKTYMELRHVLYCSANVIRVIKSRRIS
jgi:hypothetical protein